MWTPVIVTVIMHVECISSRRPLLKSPAKCKIYIKVLFCHVVNFEFTGGGGV